VVDLCLEDSETTRLGRQKEEFFPVPPVHQRMRDLQGPVYDDEDNDSSLDEDECAECVEKYNKTKSTSDWIQCVNCRK
jgi:hypothetical protein